MNKLFEEFKNPGAKFRGKPFWSWNGELSEEELKRQVDVLKEMGFGGFFMHSRSGLITEYLGDEWFDLCNKTAEYGASVGMEPWLYDEDRWPSGSAGGIVTKDPKYRMRSLTLFESFDTKPVENLFAMFEARIENDTRILREYKKIAENSEITLEAKENETVKILKFAIVLDKPSSVYNDATYLDTLSLEATEKFIEVTHEQYKNHATEAIWSEIKGIFTDEPHRGKLFGDTKTDENGNVSSSIFYTNGIFDDFKLRYGYDAIEILPELYYEAPDFETSKPLKHDYIDLGCNLFNERFAMPINKWCNENGIAFTGHVLHEDALMCQTVPNGSLMRFYANMAVPGIDNLCVENYAYWVAKQLQSVCRQYGKNQMLSELYGCTGWSFDFRGHKSVGDWQALFGINLRCPHLSWYTMEGAAKRDYPASILHQATYYKDYSYVEDYFARFGLMMQEGTPVCDVLVISPIESVWLYAKTGWANWIMSANDDVNRIEARFQETFEMLEGNMIDFDYVDEQMLYQNASVIHKNGEALLKVGNAEYRKIVLSGNETIRGTTLAILRAFVLKGGKVIVLGDAPTMVDAKIAPAPTMGFTHVPFTKDAVLSEIKADLPITINVDTEGDAKIFSQLRYSEDEDAYILALLSVSRKTQPSFAKVTVSGIPDYKYCEEWSLRDGKKYNANLNSVRFDVNTEHIFVLRKTKNDLPDAVDFYAPAKAEMILEGKFDYELSEQNALVLDFAKAKFTDNEGAVHEFEDEMLKIDFNFRDTIGIEHRSGDSLQPWYVKKFADETYGNFELNYEFNVETIPENGVKICGERPENIGYYLNGTKLSPDGNFWIDSCLKTMPVDKNLLKIGKNVVTAKGEYKRSTNIESVYVVGDFGVATKLLEEHPASFAGDHGNVYSKADVLMTKLPEKFENKNTTEQNLLFYTGCVTISVTSRDIEKVLEGKKESDRIFVTIPEYVASLVKITDLNNDNKQILAWAPYTVDVTDFADTGFKITLVCTRKNMFGPLHLVPAYPGALGPDGFVSGGEWWTDDYAMLNSRFGEITIKRV